MKLPRMKFSNAEQIRAYRKKTGLNQALFWGRIGLTQSGGSRYESDRRIPESVHILLTITYGTPAESQRMVDALRA